MASAADLQALLRFLSQDAKVPLAVSMSKVKQLQAANLLSPGDLAKSNAKSLQEIFEEEKLAKQVLNAAKRTSKKRAAGDDAAPIPKRSKAIASDQSNPAEFEKSLELPISTHNEDVLANTVLFTNRAPLVLAFAVTLLKYTMPEQPLSSRLSLAQAVVSVNSKSKALNLGIESGKSAEDEGWGQGQPTVTIMGREIRVMKRWGYDWKNDAEKREDNSQVSDKTVLGDSQPALTHEDQPPLWGIDLEALKTSNIASAERRPDSAALPIYTAQSARSYLLKSFDSPPDGDTSEGKARKRSAAEKLAEKERNLGLLLAALDLVYISWKDHLPATELDKKSWGWYMRVRPEVEHGVAGWGGKNNLKLSDVLDLRRKS